VRHMLDSHTFICRSFGPASVELTFLFGPTQALLYVHTLSGLGVQSRTREYIPLSSLDHDEDKIVFTYPAPVLIPTGYVVRGEHVLRIDLGYRGNVERIHLKETAKLGYEVELLDCVL